MDSLFGRFVEQSIFNEILLEASDRISATPVGDLLGVAIKLVVIVGRVGVIAVRLGLDEGWAVAFSSPLDSGRHGSVDGEDVVAVYVHARHVVTLRPVRDDTGDLLSGWCRDCIQVVLNKENHRQFLDRCEVHRLVPVAL